MLDPILPSNPQKKGMERRREVAKKVEKQAIRKTAKREGRKDREGMKKDGEKSVLNLKGRLHSDQIRKSPFTFLSPHCPNSHPHSHLLRLSVYQWQNQ